jgi:Tol biopolymer transport system component
MQLKPGRSEMIWEGPAWHPCISPDGNWIVTDCQPDDDHGQSDLMLIHIPSGVAQRLMSVYTSGRHPYHPHPSFSADGTRIAVQQRDEISDECRVVILTVDLQGGL